MRRVLAIMLCLLGFPVLAQSRPPTPPPDQMAWPGHAGWIVDERTGCWLRSFEAPELPTSVTWSGSCTPEGPAVGKGILAWIYQGQSSRYEGEVSGGKFNGIGKFMRADGASYEGEWKDGEWHGEGTKIWEDGRRYEGDFWHHQMHGDGRMVWGNGDSYVGQWENDRPEGLGKAIIGSIIFEGRWVSGCYRNGDRRASIGREFSECR